MKITPEMIGKFANCKSAEEIMDLAKQEKYSLTTEQSQKVFDLLQSENMTDEMMEKVIGGKNILAWPRVTNPGPGRFDIESN